MRRIDPQNPPLELFAGARSYRSQASVTAVRLTEPIVVATLLGDERGEVGDYLCRDPKTGRAWIVAKRLFESTYFIEREPRKPQRGMVIA